VKRISSAFATSFRASLLSFYDAQRRKLPWRESKDPYEVLVSELMLQQTRVETVIPYYQRWLARFPNVHALANAHVHDVLKQWEGLGYYSRARHLHGAAQIVREQYAGQIPQQHEQLRQLPGVGTYTAAAVASIAFNQPHAVVDGNVRRVLCRVLDLADPKSAELQQYADALLDAVRPGDYNQALMELGATICTPRKPSCSSCTVRQQCHAYHKGTVELRPAPKVKAPLPLEIVNCLVAIHKGAILVTQRPLQGLLAGLWEFPVIRKTAHHRHVGNILHTFTHKRIDYQVYISTKRVRVRDRVRNLDRWVSLNEMNALPFSTAQRRVAKLALPFFGL
jgi:A/G-specific adenine glycosylase